jgi:hypothetical protein
LGVTGEISLNGAPVKSGSIQLTSVGVAKVSATGAVIQDGKYEIPQAKGLPPGKYQIMISAGDENAQGVAQREGVGVTLAAVSDDGDVLALDEGEVGVVVVEHLGHWWLSFVVVVSRP